MRLYQLLSHLKQFFIWSTNGFLLSLYLVWTYKWTSLIALFALLTAFKLSKWIGKHEAAILGKWIYTSFLLLAIVSISLPETHGFLCALIVISSIVAIRLDQFHPAQSAWKFVYGAVGYSLVGGGYLLFNDFFTQGTTMDGFLLQGQNYLGVLVGVLMYLFPIGYIALLFKDMLLHKQQMAPVQMMNIIRRDGQEKS